MFNKKIPFSANSRRINASSIDLATICLNPLESINFYYFDKIRKKKKEKILYLFQCYVAPKKVLELLTWKFLLKITINFDGIRCRNSFSIHWRYRQLFDYSASTCCNHISIKRSVSVLCNRWFRLQNSIFKVKALIAHPFRQPKIIIYPNFSKTLGKFAKNKLFSNHLIERCVTDGHVKIEAYLEYW